MTLIPRTLIDGYLDETLSPDEHAALARWLKAAPENAQEFARAVLLHDRLRGELLAQAAAESETASRLSRGSWPRRLRPLVALAGVLLAMAALVLVLLRGLAETPVSAAVVELNRLIVSSTRPTDRTYQITVEDRTLSQARGPGSEPFDWGRPPKPPLDGAVLHVRGKNQFVLVRMTKEGLPFVTGSNGKTSWAARPDGPVRVSPDLTRFNRDVPGHEHAMPLSNIKEALERLRTAYEVQLLPVETAEGDVRSEERSTRLLVAVKKRGYRGPRRVEITYDVASGRIQQMRFIKMPYGPDRLTLRLDLNEERDLGAAFFDHASHHAADRTVELEE